MRTTSGEVRAEAIAADIGHVQLLWHGRYGALRVLFDECLVEEDEVSEAAACGLVGGLEGFEVGLALVSGCFMYSEAVILTSVVTRYDT